MVSRFATKIPADGPDGNIMMIAGTAGRMMRRLGLPKEEITALYQRVIASQNYDAACAVVEEYFPLDRET